MYTTLPGDRLPVYRDILLRNGVPGRCPMIGCFSWEASTVSGQAEQLEDNVNEGYSMDLHFDVPGEVARQFTAEPGGIARAAVEALAAEGVRSGKLTVYQAGQLLGIRSRYEMDGFLKTRGLFLPDTMEGVVADSQTAIAFSR